MTTSLLLVLTAAIAAVADDATLVTLDGQSIAGSIEAWDRDQATIVADDGRQTLPTAKLLEIAWRREPRSARPEKFIELVDGSRLAYSGVTVADRTATVDVAYAKRPLRIPTAWIRRIELLPPSDVMTAALEALHGKQPAGDALVIAKRNGESMDYLTGVVGDMTAEQVQFEWDGQQVDVKRSKVAVVVFYHAREAALSELVCELTLTDGSQLAASEASLADGAAILKTPVGFELRLPLEKLRRIDFSAGKIAYLSDLEPTRADWTPRIALPSAAKTIAAYGLPRKNSSFSGSPLTLLWENGALPSRRDLQTYVKGLAVRSRTELEYRIPQGMRRFTAVAGIDPDSVGTGHVKLEIRGDDALLWEGPIDGRRPVTIDVELAAARRLRLLVDYGDNLDYGDRLHLVEARFTK